jgi:Flp pilus assembly protein TadD
VAACRQALALGLSRPRAAVVRRTLALKLIALRREGEAIAVYREAARAEPGDAEVHLRLGQALLAMAGDAEAAVIELRRAALLRPEEARMHGALALALAASGQAAEATVAFEAALRLDPGFLESRPGARRAYEAARKAGASPAPP